MHLSLGGLVFTLALSSYIPHAPATVVQDFNTVERCKDSLYKGTLPKGIADGNLKKICQRYADKPRYVTLYDPRKHIPLYSAYSFKKTDAGRRGEYPWMYEPQLAEVNGNGNMAPFPTGTSQLNTKIQASQAVLDDYSDVYKRGLLNPDLHQSDPQDRTATYTLTNVVPQLNVGPWRQHEERIRARLSKYCRGTAFIITGVTTRGSMIRRNNQDRVAIPEDMWSAYCCSDYDRNAPHDVRIRFPTQAALGKNAKEGNTVNEMTVQDLETHLKTNMGLSQNLQLFYNNCI